MLEGFKLEAPHTQRYVTFFNGIAKGDAVLHYTTIALSKKEWRGKILAVSLVASPPRIIGKKLVSECENTIFLPEPVQLSELRKISDKSLRFEELFRISLQRYLTQITKSDFDKIVALHSSNKERIKCLINNL